jgi:UDP-N-acetylglucosamine 2-epimerase
MRVMSVVGARPQFVKAAVVSRALSAAGIDELLVHTGQHYDEQMSAAFFRDLAIRAPDLDLEIGSGSHGEQTGRMLCALEGVMVSERPDRVLVYGDTNTTLAAALAAAKLRVPVDHIEAGLRSFDRDMPEEQNRVLADHLADQLMCPTAAAVANLADEGITTGVLLVGDVMLDLALAIRAPALEMALPAAVPREEYFIVTIHRPSNTDDPQRLGAVLEHLREVSDRVAPVVIPVHPRLRARLAGRDAELRGLVCLEPAGYPLMQALILRSRGVITDSGGVQKEALFHGVPCLTLRDTTEWTESVDAGMNRLLGDALHELPAAAAECRGRVEVPRAVLDAFGGGEAGRRIAEAVRAAGGSRQRWRMRA